jgi:hypothetical protein
MASYRDINYSIRPAKNIERKMLIEAFRRLSFIDDLKNYRYIGFGSTYFSDFELIHKELNITNLISIEADLGSAPRFEFNRPYSCVNLKFDYSYNILPTLNYDTRDIIWLDYDGIFNKYMLDDIDTVISNVKMGSVFLISLNVENPKLILCEDEKLDHQKRKEKTQKKLEEVNEILQGYLNISDEISPLNIDNSIFKKWNFAKKCTQVINDQIHKSIQNRSSIEKNGLTYQQLFNFHYADGSKMLTIGGIVFDNELVESVKNCHFDKLDFIRKGDEALEINVPNLTFREIKYLNKYISLDDITKFPKDVSGKTIDTIVPPKEIKMYHEIYRYFPTFSETSF